MSDDYPTRPMTPDDLRFACWRVLQFHPEASDEFRQAVLEMVAELDAAEGGDRQAAARVRRKLETGEVVMIEVQDNVHDRVRRKVVAQ